MICLAFLAAQGAQAAGEVPIVDLIPDLLNFQKAAPKEGAERARIFATEFIQPHPEIYQRPDIFKTDLPALERYLEGLNAYLPAISHLHDRFESERVAVESKFEAAFPDFEPSKTKIFLMLSLFRFDGKIPHDNPHILLLGLDGLAKFHGENAKIPVILSHELFHLYHFQVNPLPHDTDDIPLYRLVWQEGMATYVSHVLNPDVPLSDVFLDPRLATEGPKYLPMFCQSFLHDLTSVDDATAIRYLSYHAGGLTPSRMGYLIGYEIVQQAAMATSLSALARVKGHDLLNLVRSGTQALAARSASK